MDNETQEEHDGVRRDWLAHPYTQGWGKSFGKKVLAARETLKGICRTSVDPKVQAQISKLDELEVMAKTFGVSV